MVYLNEQERLGGGRRRDGAQKTVPVTLKQRGREDRETVVVMPVGAQGLEAEDERI